MDSSKVISILEANGWVFSRIRGDHWYYVKSGFARPTCVTHPKKDIPKGTFGRHQAIHGYQGTQVSCTGGEVSPRQFGDDHAFSFCRRARR